MDSHHLYKKNSMQKPDTWMVLVWLINKIEIKHCKCKQMHFSRFFLLIHESHYTLPLQTDASRPVKLSVCPKRRLFAKLTTSFYVIYSDTVITSCCTIQAARCPQQTELQLKYLFLERSNFSTYPPPKNIPSAFPQLSESYFKKSF